MAINLTKGQKVNVTKETPRIKKCYGWAWLGRECL